MSTFGLDFDADSSLVGLALTAIHRSPISTGELAREVFGLRQAPPGLASRLVYELLGTDRRVQVDGRGVWSLTAATETAEVPLASVGFVVVDVETTGSSVARGARIMEFAAVEVSRGRIVGEYSTLVNPGARIPRWVTRLTGIDSPMVVDAPRFEDIAGEVERRLRGRVFVAHNAGFDWRFVAEEMRRARAVMPSGPRLCTVRLARRALPGLRRRGLDSLARYYDIEIVDRHRAGGDARATACILIHLLDAADRQGIHSWSQLEDWVAGQIVRRAAPDLARWRAEA
jgi:DNA polymerase-3 subunit epsilon